MPGGNAPVSLNHPLVRIERQQVCKHVCRTVTGAKGRGTSRQTPDNRAILGLTDFYNPR